MERKRKPTIKIPAQIEEPPFDPARIAHELAARAKRGDERAIRELLFAGTCFAESLADLGFHGDSETQNAVKKIAAEELLWPAVVSRHGRVRGNHRETERYLLHIGLGNGKNLSKLGPDPRTHRHLPGIMFFFDLVRLRGVSLTRGGEKGRDTWLASKAGKAAVREVRKIIAEYRWETLATFEITKPLAEHAEHEAKRGASTKQLSKTTPSAIRREFVNTIVKGLHGILGD